MDLKKLDMINRYIEELSTIKREIIDEESKFLAVEKYRCHLNNGKMIIREKMLKNQKDGSAAIVFPITVDNQVILAMEPRVFTEKTVDIGLPAGYIEYLEEPIKAASRELKEETGYQSNDLIHLGSFYQDQGVSAAYNHYFLAKDCIKVGKQNLDEGEFIKYILVSLDELDWLLENGYINGLNSVYTIEKVKKLIK